MIKCIEVQYLISLRLFLGVYLKLNRLLNAYFHSISYCFRGSLLLNIFPNCMDFDILN